MKVHNLIERGKGASTNAPFYSRHTHIYTIHVLYMLVLYTIQLYTILCSSGCSTTCDKTSQDAPPPRDLWAWSSLVVWREEEEEGVKLQTSATLLMMRGTRRGLLTCKHTATGSGRVEGGAILLHKILIQVKIVEIVRTNMLK